MGFDAVFRRNLPLILPLDYFILCHLTQFPSCHVNSGCIIHLRPLLRIVLSATCCQPQSFLFEHDSYFHSLFICHLWQHRQWTIFATFSELIFLLVFDFRLPLVLIVECHVKTPHKTLFYSILRILPYKNLAITLHRQTTKKGIKSNSKKISIWPKHFR